MSIMTYVILVIKNILWGGNRPWGSCRTGAVVQGRLSGCSCPGGSCPGGSCPRT